MANATIDPILDYGLVEGCLKALLNGEDRGKIVLQFLGVNDDPAVSIQEEAWYPYQRVSDGVNEFAYVMTQFDKLEDEPPMFSIVETDDFYWLPDENVASRLRKVLMVGKLTIIVPGATVGKIIGCPKRFDSPKEFVASQFEISGALIDRLGAKQHHLNLENSVLLPGVLEIFHAKKRGVPSPGCFLYEISAVTQEAVIKAREGCKLVEQSLPPVSLDVWNRFHISNRTFWENVDGTKVSYVVEMGNGTVPTAIVTLVGLIDDVTKFFTAINDRFSALKCDTQPKTVAAPAVSTMTSEPRTTSADKNLLPQSGSLAVTASPLTGGRGSSSQTASVPNSPGPSRTKPFKETVNVPSQHFDQFVRKGEHLLNAIRASSGATINADGTVKRGRVFHVSGQEENVRKAVEQITREMTRMEVSAVEELPQPSTSEVLVDHTPVIVQTMVEPDQTRSGVSCATTCTSDGILGSSAGESVVQVAPPSVLKVVAETSVEQLDQTTDGTIKSTENHVVQDCILCEDANATTVFVPCGHQHFCLLCARKAFKKKKECPSCRAAAVTVWEIKVFR